MLFMAACDKTDKLETEMMQNDIACDFGHNMGLPLYGHFNDTTLTLKQIAKANHVYKCRCQSQGYVFKDECLS